jgi:type II secretory pathway component GspD/PulD (secretin)
VSAPEAGAQTLEPRPDSVTRIYRPRYLSGSALYSLIVPLLTPNLGRAGAADLASRETAAASGENSSGAPIDALVVYDVPDVIHKIDVLFQKLDVPPENVVIEAVVLSVQIDHVKPNGIDLLEFNGPSQPFTMTADDAGTAFGSFIPSSGAAPDDPLRLTRRYGLKRGNLTGDPQAFLSAVQTAAPTRRLDAWQMTVANRQSASLMLTDPYGPGGSCDQSVAATILRIRPLIARNGVVHLDVRQDVGLDSVAVAGSRAAALTNQFSLHAGQTAVIGGLFADQLVVEQCRPSGIGRIPVFGGLFSKQFEAIERTETIVLLTPHVVSPDAEQQLSRATRPAMRTDSAAKTPKIIPTSVTGDSAKTAKITPTSDIGERKVPSKLRVNHK